MTFETAINRNDSSALWNSYCSPTNVSVLWLFGYVVEIQWNLHMLNSVVKIKEFHLLFLTRPVDKAVESKESLDFSRTAEFEKFKKTVVSGWTVKRSASQVVFKSD